MFYFNNHSNSLNIVNYLA